MEKQRYFNEIDLVRQLPEDDRLFLERNSVHRRYPHATIIHAPGHPGATVNFVLGGRVKIYNLSACGKEIIYRFCTPNSFFGIAEIFGGEEREVFAEAVEDTEVMTTDKKHFEELILRNPSLALTVIRILGSRIRQAHNAIQGFVFCDARTRLAQLLVKLAQINGAENADGTITLRNRFTHQELAHMIGAIRQTVTENLNHLKHHGYVRIDGERITLVDPVRLGELIED
ncbi:MAG: Crp/Fnr family transcriptional regulator [Sulfuricella sp.]|nr:Crp/Fnr family transcriptional regulator [Sulfuricella sp.]